MKINHRREHTTLRFVLSCRKVRFIVQLIATHQRIDVRGASITFINITYLHNDCILGVLWHH
jgi:hypothetical protein